jgi:hypothetical protein
VSEQEKILVKYLGEGWRVRKIPKPIGEENLFRMWDELLAISAPTTSEEETVVLDFMKSWRKNYVRGCDVSAFSAFSGLRGCDRQRGTEILFHLHKKGKIKMVRTMPFTFALPERNALGGVH